MTKSWSTIKRYKLSNQVEVSIQYKHFDMIQGYAGEKRIEVHNNRGGYKSYADNKYVARSIRLLIECYDITPQQEYGNNIPLAIALVGRPAIAVYLCGACDYEIVEVAEIMGVSEATVQKYIMRNEKLPYWSFDPDYEATFDLE